MNKPMMSFAVAHAMKKKAKKMADGGSVPDPDPKNAAAMQKGAMSSGTPSWDEIKKNVSEGLGMAEGGEAYKGDRLTGSKNARMYSAQSEQKGINTPRMPYPRSKESYGESSAGYSAKGGLNEQAKEQHKKTLHEMHSMKKPNLMAEGGDVRDEHDMEMLNQMGDEDEGAGDMDSIHPMIQKIMMGRMKGYSEGGKVANEESGESTDEPTFAKESGNEFDDLALDDDLEEHYTGANSGDEMGDEQENHDEHDIVMRVLKSRAKKDRMPRPA